MLDVNPVVVAAAGGAAGGGGGSNVVINVVHLVVILIVIIDIIDIDIRSFRCGQGTIATNIPHARFCNYPHPQWTCSGWSKCVCRLSDHSENSRKRGEKYRRI